MSADAEFVSPTAEQLDAGMIRRKKGHRYYYCHSCNLLSQQPIIQRRYYQSLSTWMTSSTRVRGPCMPSVFCVHTACAYHFCFRFSSQSSSRSSPTLLQRGGRGFSTSADRQRIEPFLRRAARSGLWESATTAEELVDDADERLFSKVRHCAHHVLEELLPPASDSQHNLRKRRHNNSP